MILFLLCGVILSLLILIQRGRGGGLAGAFGGAGGSSAFGTKTADIFVKATAVLGAIFFVLAIVTAILMQHNRAGGTRGETQGKTENQAPADPAGGAGAPTDQAPPAAPEN
jgi:preprotein translocase subunit SecG